MKGVCASGQDPEDELTNRLINCQGRGGLAASAHDPKRRSGMTNERSNGAEAPAVRGRRGALAKRAPVSEPRGKNPKNVKKKPGRPGGASTVRESILTVAEDMFSNLGYAGTTLREIANGSHVTQ